MSEKTAAQKRAQKNYMGKFVRLEIRTSAEKRDAIREHINHRAESMNAFINRAIDETMKRDKQN